LTTVNIRAARPGRPTLILVKAARAPGAHDARHACARPPAGRRPRHPVKRLAVLTSGGDAPGMNAAIRAVTRAGIHEGFEVFGIRHGYSGLIAGDFRPLGARDVGGIIDSAGTFLGSTRCEALRTEAGLRQALRNIEAQALTALVVIGGNGSQTGAWALCRAGAPLIGVASTIDNDVVGADPTIGTTSAAEVAMEAIDRLRVTAASLQRTFLVEVMGRSSGHLALAAGIAGGAEDIVIPEVETSAAEVARHLRDSHRRGKRHAIVVVAEGASPGVDELAGYLQGEGAGLAPDLRVTRLGHIQRGGAPCAFDRLLASRVGAAAAGAAAGSRFGIVLGLRLGEVAETPLAEVAGRVRPADRRLHALATVLET
jgi:6-phosphofructokinase 1